MSEKNLQLYLTVQSKDARRTEIRIVEYSIDMTTISMLRSLLLLSIEHFSLEERLLRGFGEET